MTPSPWPLTASISSGYLTLGIIIMFISKDRSLLVLAFLGVIITATLWWRDISREATFQGHHRYLVATGMRWGIGLFITSEVLFFFAFFWAYFHVRLSPTLDVGFQWPPVATPPINPLGVPLLNTVVLLSSGLTVTWCHHAILNRDHYNAVTACVLTVLLGIYFLFIQILEYLDAPFTFSDSVYGSIFFLATGFHGAHVFIGIFILSVIGFRLYNGHFSRNHHFGFEAAAWYWHFVDVVWVILYLCVYFWGS